MLPGLAHVAKTKPKMPVQVLAHFLLKNNPNAPKVEEAVVEEEAPADA